MKKIIAALVVFTMVHFGAEAQTSKCNSRSVTKHASTMHMRKHKNVAQSSNTVGIQGQQTITEACRVVPYNVCKINPDRRSVSCYKTIDPYGEQPFYYDDAITYGPNGKMPGEANRQPAGTIVVNPPAPVNYCKRNEANNATICYTPGELTRDEFGFYNYDLR